MNLEFTRYMKGVCNERVDNINRVEKIEEWTTLVLERFDGGGAAS
jgi:hypothetical protein